MSKGELHDLILKFPDRKFKVSTKGNIVRQSNMSTRWRTICTHKCSTHHRDECNGKGRSQCCKRSKVCIPQVKMKELAIPIKKRKL